MWRLPMFSFKSGTNASLNVPRISLLTCRRNQCRAALPLSRAYANGDGWRRWNTLQAPLSRSRLLCTSNSFQPLQRIVYEVKNKTVLRATGFLLLVQSIYWGFYVYDIVMYYDYFKNATYDADLVGQLTFFGLYTHPGWAIAGSLVTLGGAVLYKIGCNRLVSRMAISSGSNEVAIYTHNIFGGTSSAPLRRSMLDVNFIAPTSKSTYVFVEVKNRKGKFLIDRTGSFIPTGFSSQVPGQMFQNTDSTKLQPYLENSVFRELGAPWALGSINSQNENNMAPRKSQPTRRY